MPVVVFYHMLVPRGNHLKVSWGKFILSDYLLFRSTRASEHRPMLITPLAKLIEG